MNVQAILKITGEATKVYRKGEIVERRDIVTGRGTVVGEVVEINAYPHADEAAGALVDMVFVEVAVDLATAEPKRAELMRAIGDGIGPESGKDYLQGPSYIHIGADLGDQEYAIRFMALCSVLHIGKLITPMSLGFEGDSALMMAGNGLIYMQLVANVEDK